MTRYARVVHSPTARRNVAVEALALVDELEPASPHLFHAVRADLLTRLGRRAEAREAVQAALPLTEREADRALLRARLAVSATWP